MKSMEEYIDEVYKKYEESEKNHIVYKKVKMKRSNPLPILCGIAACLVVVALVYSNLSSVKPDPNNEQKYVSNETNEDGSIIYTNKIKFSESLFENNLEFLVIDSEMIMLVSYLKTNNTHYEILNNRFILKKNIVLNVDNVLLGNKNKEKSLIHCSKVGGIISLSELQQDKSIDWKSWEKEHIGREVPEEEKEHSYFKQYVPGACEFEEGKQYLVFMNYDEENDVYEFTNIKYGIMEYDPVTNMVKNVDTGEFEEFDWSLITNE